MAHEHHGMTMERRAGTYLEPGVENDRMVGVAEIRCTRSGFLHAKCCSRLSLCPLPTLTPFVPLVWPL